MPRRAVDDWGRSGSCAGYPKPAWQSVVGNPADGVRDVPDVSLFAANGLWSHYYIACYSDPNNSGATCSGAPEHLVWIRRDFDLVADHGGNPGTHQ